MVNILNTIATAAQMQPLSGDHLNLIYSQGEKDMKKQGIPFHEKLHFANISFTFKCKV